MKRFILISVFFVFQTVTLFASRNWGGRPSDLDSTPWPLWMWFAVIAVCFGYAYLNDNREAFLLGLGFLALKVFTEVLGFALDTIGSWGIGIVGIVGYFLYLNYKEKWERKRREEIEKKEEL